MIGLSGDNPIVLNVCEEKYYQIGLYIIKYAIFAI